jgi:hypothetical protein
MIPGYTSFSEKQFVCKGVHSASLGKIAKYLNEKMLALVQKTESNDRGGFVALTDTPLPSKIGTNFAYFRRSVHRYRTLND